jgi:hypothetical protein
LNSTSFVSESTNTFSAVGFSVIGSGVFSAYGGRVFNFSGFCKNTLGVFSCGNVTISTGTRVKGLVSISQCYCGVASANVVNTSGYAPTIFEGGLLVADSLALRIDSGQISGPTHCIESKHSRLWLNGAVSGAGAAGAGVYAHSGSVVHTKAGAPPTITGTVGDLSTDGTTQASTWAAIEAGAPVAVLAEMTMAKKVA